MDYRKYRWGIPALLLAIGLLSACGSPAAPPPAAATVAAPAEAAPAPAAAATTSPVAEAATAAPAEEAPAGDAPVAAPAAPVDWLQSASLEGDYFTLGNPDAPVRVLDYSDFL